MDIEPTRTRYGFTVNVANHFLVIPIGLISLGLVCVAIALLVTGFVLWLREYWGYAFLLCMFAWMIHWWEGVTVSRQTLPLVEKALSKTEDDGLLDRISDVNLKSKLRGSSKCLGIIVFLVAGIVLTVTWWDEEEIVSPPYIKTEGRNIVIVFQKLDSETEKWTIPFEELEQDVVRGNAKRQELRFERPVYAVNSEGFTIEIPNYATFVDPSPFSELVDSLYKDSGEDERFIKETWNMVTQLALYSYEEKETPRYPLETLLAGGGDCEDTAILFASIILAAPVEWNVKLVYMDSNNPTNFKKGNHMIAYVDTGERDYYINTTNNKVFSYKYVDGWFIDIQ